MREESFKAAKFLIVDDEPANISMLEEILAQWDCSSVQSTTDSREAVPLYLEYQPDIILLDLMMPYPDGFEVMERLKPLIPAGEYLPILVLTADPTTQVKRRALAVGAKDFLTKPFDMVELSLRISNLTEIGSLHHQLRDQNQILERRVVERTLELVESREQLRALAANLTIVREDERTQVAREVHDGLGQALTGLKIDLAWLDKQLLAAPVAPSSPIRLKTSSMLQRIDTTIQLVQRLASQLRPALLDDFGLEAAVEWQVQDFQELTNLQCDCDSSLGEIPLPGEQSTAVFRILQEALTNIARHAAASRVIVLLEENAGHLRLEVQDDGCGMNRAAVSDIKSLGLLGMRERARLVGGEVAFHSGDGQGTTVTVCVPLPEASHP